MSDSNLRPEVSVVIPTRNRARLLLQTIRSVLYQQGVVYEVIVIDEASTDATADVLGSLDDPRIRVIRHTAAVGVAAARNAGAATATAPLVAFIDDDDLWAPWKLRRQLDALDADPGAGWAICGAVTFDEPRGAIVRWARTPEVGALEHELHTWNPVPGGASGVVVRSTVLRDVGGFDETLSIVEDWDLWVRLALAARATAVDGPAVAWRRHATNATKDATAVEREFRAFFAKHQARRTALGIEVDWAQIDRALGAIHRDGGARLGALRAYWRAARTGPVVPAIVRALTLLPGGRRIADRHGRQSLPPSWRRDLEQWLGRAAASSIE